MSENKKTKPGSITSLNIRYKNNNTLPIPISIHVQANPGWKVINNNAQFIVQAGDSIRKTIFIGIPRYAKSGMAYLETKIFNSESGEELSRFHSAVDIESRYEIKAVLMNAPEFIQAGESSSISYSVTNLSNCPVKAYISIFQPNDTLHKNIRLAADTVVEISKIIKTREVQKISSLEFVHLRIRIAESDSVNIYQSNSYQVIPNANLKIDPYFRFPVEISSRYVRQAIGSQNPDGYQFEISGSGSINERPDRQLSFRFRGPNQTSLAILGLQDEYFMNFQSKQHGIILGDFNYSLTQLTEPVRYGRGLQYTLKQGHWNYGIMAYKPRFYTEDIRSEAAYLSYHFNENALIKTAYLHKTTDNIQETNLLSLSTALNPYPWLNLETEIAGSKSDSIQMAIQANAAVRLPKINLSASIIMAEKAFQGYFSDAIQYTFNSNIPLFKNVRLNSSIHYNRKNVDYDSMQFREPYSRHLMGSLQIQLNKKSQLSLGGKNREYEDPYPANQFHFKESGANITFHTRGKFIQLQLGSEFGSSRNYLSAGSGTSSYFDASSEFSYGYEELVNLSIFGKFSRNQRYDSIQSNQFFFGTMVRVNYSRFISANLSLQNNFERIEYYRDRNLAQIELEFKPHDRHRFKIGGSYTLLREELNTASHYIYGQYTYSPGIVTGIRKNIGSLKGKIITSEGAMVQNAIVTINGSKVLTNWDGSFTFTQIPAGEYNIFISTSKDAINTIVLNEDDLTVKILGGKTSIREIILTRSAELSGKFVLETDSVKRPDVFFQTTEQRFNFIVEARFRDDVKRVLSDKDGRFRFTDLKPGQYSIKVYSMGQNRDYLLENEYFTVNLMPGESGVLLIPVKIRTRKIKMIGNK